MFMGKEITPVLLGHADTLEITIDENNKMTITGEEGITPVMCDDTVICVTKTHWQEATRDSHTFTLLMQYGLQNEIYHLLCEKIQTYERNIKDLEDLREKF